MNLSTVVGLTWNTFYWFGLFIHCYYVSWLGVFAYCCYDFRQGSFVWCKYVYCLCRCFCCWSVSLKVYFMRKWYYSDTRMDGFMCCHIGSLFGSRYCFLLVHFFLDSLLFNGVIIFTKCLWNKSIPNTIRFQETEEQPGGRGRSTYIRRDPQRVEPSRVWQGPEIRLKAEKGGGGGANRRDTAAGSGMRSGAQGREVEASGKQVRAKSR